MNTLEVPNLNQLLDRLHLVPDVVSKVTFTELLKLRLQQVAVDQLYDQQPIRMLRYSRMDPCNLSDPCDPYHPCDACNSRHL
jgi:hypothetical protein